MATSKPPPLKIAIIGAGIAGLTLALALKINHPDFSVTIFEARLRFSEISAAVSFGPNAMKALSLISPKLAEAYTSVATLNQEGKQTSWYTVRSGKTGEILRVVEMKDGFQYSSASRVKFLEKLVGELDAGVEVKFGRRIIDIIFPVSEGEKTRLRFEDDTEAFVDAVIGCDGIRSVCRRLLVGEEDESAAAVYTGKYAYRKVLSMKSAISAVGTGVLNRQLFVGENGHILTHPINNGKALNVVAFRDAKGLPWVQRQWVVPSSRTAVLKDFEGWDDSVVKILELMENPDKWALFDTIPSPAYSSGNFCILGDAAHASTPHLDAGAGFAIEDVHLLSSLLEAEIVTSAEDFKYAFAAWDELRRPRCEELIRRSRKQGKLLEMQEDGWALTEEEVRDELEASQRWVWEVDLEAMVSEGANMMKKRKEERVCSVF